MAPRSEEYGQSPVSALKRLGSEEELPSPIMGAKQFAASPQGKSFWPNHPRLAVTDRQDRQFHVRAIGSGPSPAASHLGRAVSWEAESATGYELFLFLVDQVRPLLLPQLIRN